MLGATTAPILRLFNRVFAAVDPGFSERGLGLWRWRYLDNPEARLPTLQWPREIPIAGEPADVVEIVGAYAVIKPVQEQAGVILKAGGQARFCFLQRGPRLR